MKERNKMWQHKFFMFFFFFYFEHFVDWEHFLDVAEDQRQKGKKRLCAESDWWGWCHPHTCVCLNNDFFYDLEETMSSSACYLLLSDVWRGSCTVGKSPNDSSRALSTTASHRSPRPWVKCGELLLTLQRSAIFWLNATNWISSVRNSDFLTSF